MAPKRTHEDYARVLEPLAAALKRLSDMSVQGPNPGSLAQHESRTQVGRIAWVLGLSAAVVGADHLGAWQAIRLDARLQPALAHLTLIRSAVEGCAVARWLADPALGTTERMRRAAGAQLDDYNERIKFERRLGSRLPKPRGRGRTGMQRKEELENRLRRLGIAAIPLPPTTELFARYFFPRQPDEAGGEAFFRQISAVTHAKVWSLYAISEIQVIDRGDGLHAAKISANEETTFLATVLTMELVAAAVADLTQYGAPLVASPHAKRGRREPLARGRRRRHDQLD